MAVPFDGASMCICRVRRLLQCSVVFSLCRQVKLLNWLFPTHPPTPPPRGHGAVSHVCVGWFILEGFSEEASVISDRCVPVCVMGTWLHQAEEDLNLQQVPPENQDLF